VRSVVVCWACPLRPAAPPHCPRALSSPPPSTLAAHRRRRGGCAVSVPPSPFRGSDRAAAGECVGEGHRRLGTRAWRAHWRGGGAGAEATRTSLETCWGGAGTGGWRRGADGTECRDCHAWYGPHKKEGGARRRELIWLTRQLLEQPGSEAWGAYRGCALAGRSLTRCRLPRLGGEGEGEARPLLRRLAGLARRGGLSSSYPSPSSRGSGRPASFLSSAL
jgi:hypothetical protein